MLSHLPSVIPLLRETETRPGVLRRSVKQGPVPVFSHRRNVLSIMRGEDPVRHTHLLSTAFVCLNIDAKVAVL